MEIEEEDKPKIFIHFLDDTDPDACQHQENDPNVPKKRMMKSHELCLKVVECFANPICYVNIFINYQHWPPKSRSINVGDIFPINVCSVVGVQSDKRAFEDQQKMHTQLVGPLLGIILNVVIQCVEANLTLGFKATKGNINQRFAVIQRKQKAATPKYLGIISKVNDMKVTFTDI
uniref:Uncharacterized protein n=1 Tax=Glossina pallidipes TaxID=7398 RepID=A0A1A9ZTP6_GLOPL